jgi:hypothetical protein
MNHDLYAAAKRVQKLYQSLNRKAAQPVIHQGGHLWLANLQQPCRFVLRESALPKHSTNRSRQTHFSFLHLWLNNAEIKRNVRRTPNHARATTWTAAHPCASLKRA